MISDNTAMAFKQNSMAKQNGVDRERVAWNGAESVPDSENGEDSGFSTSSISNADFQGQLKNLFYFY